MKKSQAMANNLFDQSKLLSLTLSPTASRIAMTMESVKDKWPCNNWSQRIMIHQNLSPTILEACTCAQRCSDSESQTELTILSLKG